MLNIESFVAWIKKHKMKTILVIIGMFLVPLIVVHLLFKWDTGYDFISAEWSAGDLIGYIAGFEAFAGTVILGTIAVWQTYKANQTNDNLLSLTEENERKSVLPFLSFNSYIPKYEGNSLISLIAKAMPGSKTNEDTDKFILKTVEKGQQSMSNADYIKLENEGNDMLDVYSIPFTILVEKHFDLGLYFDLTKKIHGSYRLVFTYQDIYMNEYRQKIPLEIHEKNYSIDFYRPQEQPKKKVMSNTNG